MHRLSCTAGRVTSQGREMLSDVRKPTDNNHLTIRTYGAVATLSVPRQVRA